DPRHPVPQPADGPRPHPRHRVRGPAPGSPGGPGTDPGAGLSPQPAPPRGGSHGGGAAVNRPFTLALVGNPNSGKSTLFNALTGARQKVGNWPGVTVEKKTGHCHHGETLLEVVDLPGTYGLHVSHGDDSIDQQIAQRFILLEPVDLLVNIIDASSLERGLYLSTQLLDAGVPLVIALNMMDVANQQGVHIDPYEPSSRIGVPVLPIVASRDDGSGNLVAVVANHRSRPRPRPA